MTDVESQIATLRTRRAPTAVHAEYMAKPASIRVVRELVADLARGHEADADTVEDIRLGLSEAVTNVIRHAYAHGPIGAYRVSATVADGRLEVLVEDDGCGLDVPALDPGLGMGMRIMDSVTESAAITARPTGGTMVRLVFSLA